MTGTFLRDDGTFATPAGGGGTPGGSSGQVQVNNAGAFGGETNTQLTARINQFSHSVSGAVPIATGSGTFLKEDGSWQIPGAGPGSGTVLGYFNVMDFGAVGNGIVDDTAAIQATIDAAWAHNTLGAARVIYLPANYYKTSLPIFNDAPEDLRGIGTTPAWSGSATYASGNVVLSQGIPWASQQNSNTNHTPVLPPKVRNVNYAIGDIVEYKNQYWVALQAPSPGVFIRNPAYWASTTKWWLPTTVAPNTARWNSSFIGEEGLGSTGDNFGTIILPTFNNVPALWACHGNGNLIRSITIQGPTNVTNDKFSYRRGQPSGGHGIAIAAGDGASSRTLVENCEVDNFYYGISVGANGDSLGDSNTFRKCVVTNAAYGISFLESQNFINDCYSCNVAANVAYHAPKGQSCTVVGGNPSATFAEAAAFPVSGLANFGNGGGANGGFYYGFNLTINNASDTTFGLEAGIYDWFFMVTQSFGVIPMQMSGYDQSTGICAMLLDFTWSQVSFFNQDAQLMSDLVAELTAVTTIYAAERVTIFNGNGFNTLGMHIENEFAPTTLINSFETFGTNPASTLTGIINNYDPSLYYGNTTDVQKAQFYAAAMKEYISTEAAPVTLDSMTWATSAGAMNRIGIAHVNQLSMRRCPFLNGCLQNIGYSAFDAGIFEDGNPYLNRAAVNVFDPSEDINPVQPYRGWAPANYTVPAVLSRFLPFFEGTLPPITNFNSGANIGFQYAYPLLFGNQMYRVQEETNNPKASCHIMSTHAGWTLGQDLVSTVPGPGNVPNLAWHYKGQSNCVYANIELLRLVFPGLVIGLDNGTGSGYIFYTVSSVFPQLGYFRIIGIVNLAGVKTTTYTGGSGGAPLTIKQQPFVVRRIGRAQQINYQTGGAGSSQFLNNEDTELIFKPSGVAPIGSYTMLLCPAPFDTQSLRIKTTKTITTLTLTPNAGQFTVVGNVPTTIAAGQAIEGVYSKADSTWYF